MSWAVFAIADAPLGITTALSAVAGFVAMPFVGTDAVWHKQLLGPDRAESLIRLVVPGRRDPWGAGPSVQQRPVRLEMVPATWPSPARRFAAAFVGGAIEMYGARLAGGCVSGHGISGTLQLALSSWVFTILMFATAILLGSSLYSEDGSRR